MYVIRIEPNEPPRYFKRDDCEAVPLAEALQYNSRNVAEREREIVARTWDVTGAKVERVPAERGDTEMLARYRLHIFPIKSDGKPTDRPSQSLWVTCTEDAIVTTMQAWSNALQRLVRLYAQDDGFPEMDLDNPPQWCTPDWEFEPK